MEKIIQETEIDEEAARQFLNDFYHDVELFPSVPTTLTIAEAAELLNVSIPTIERMLNDKSIELKKQSLLNYVMANMLVNTPVKWGDNEIMNAKAREMTEEEKADVQKNFQDIEDSIARLTKEEELPGLFSEEDFN